VTRDQVTTPAGPTGATRRRAASTKTSTFGVSKREGHDASDFYSRFEPMYQDSTGSPALPETVDQLVTGDSRNMLVVNDDSVALVVTSPPYYAGKEYETELGQGGVPSSYIDYLLMLRDVFAECWRVLEPGGRIAVNVANLGRKPYRSLSADVTTILQDDLGFLMRGEILWVKAEGASGSCAWGSYMSASNPVLRDVSERVIIASKLRLDRAFDRKKRARLGMPHENTISKEEFHSATLDTWRIRPESAKRVGHPAPFPVELPRRLIELYSYKNDLILDPFVGAGTTAVAALRSHRHYVGYDTDPTYIELAESRVALVAEELLSQE
jgi:modification methylase